MNESRIVVEQIKIQERAPFDDFLLTHCDQTQRRSATKIEIEKMDKSLQKLSQIFGQIQTGWSVDGALNISFYKGDYIGVHKDVDISIEPSHLSFIERELEKHGYGLFLSYPKEKNNPGGVKIMERIDSQSFIVENSEHLMVAAIDENGVILKESDLNFLDVHLVNRDQHGLVVGFGGVELPDRWFKPVQQTFRGISVMRSNPIKVAYYKLHDTRSYDIQDLKILTESGVIRQKDVEELSQVCEKEIDIRKLKVSNYLSEIIKKIRNAQVSDVEGAFAMFADDQRINKSLDRLREAIRKISLLAINPQVSESEIESAALEILGINKAAEELRNKIKILSGFIQASQRSERVLDALNNY
jgi:hypothetical protein